MDLNSELSPLIQLDQRLLYQINPSKPQFFLDHFMIVVSSHGIWMIPLLLWFSYVYVKKIRSWWVFALLVIMIVGASDFIAYQFLKPYFGRVRPCKVDDLVRVVYSCGGTYSFPSNHATNSMTFAFLLFWWSERRKLAYFFMGISILVGLSRVYLGVHYPGDVMFGSFLGALWASIVSIALLRFTNLKEKLGGVI